MGRKDLLKLILACWLALIGWVNPGRAYDIADRCQQLYKNSQYEQAFPVCRKAAEQGNAKAQFNFAVMCMPRAMAYCKAVRQQPIGITRPAFPI